VMGKSTRPITKRKRKSEGMHNYSRETTRYHLYHIGNPNSTLQFCNVWFWEMKWSPLNKYSNSIYWIQQVTYFRTLPNYPLQWIMWLSTHHCTIHWKLNSRRTTTGYQGSTLVTYLANPLTSTSHYQGNYFYK
jgi:hypothetical protein